MNRPLNRFLPHILAVLALLALLAPVATRPASATPFPLAEIIGTVIGFDTGTQHLRVSTRLGTFVFQVTSDTLVFINNRSSTITNVRVDDEVRVQYRFD